MNALTFKRTVVVLCLMGGLSSHVAWAQVPVTDGVSIAQNAASWAKDLQQWAQNFQNWKSQYDALMSGNITQLLTGLGVNGTRAAAATSNGSFGKAAEDAYMLNKDACGPSSNGGYYNACLSARRMRAQTLMEMDTIMKGVEQRSTQINQLLNNGKNSLTAGKMQSLQYRMAGLQALLQNDLARLQVSIAIHKQKVEMYEQQMREERHNSFYGNGKPVPISF